MSRTFKDRPYRLAVEEAKQHGVVWTHWNGATVGDACAYGWMTGNRMHVPLDRMRCWYFIEDDWYPTYGNERRIRQTLKQAANSFNHGLADEDWDEPEVYQRRRVWRIC